MRATLSGGYLDEALADFSGYRAIDEVYDGPFCILSAVDDRRYGRLTLSVLDHDPAHDDIRSFLGEFRGQLEGRRCQVRGVTTDGSPLYPKVLKESWPTAPHQVCESRVPKEITKAVLRALARLREEMAADTPEQPRGRPSKARRGQARKAARQKRRVAELFEHRHPFVGHHLGAAQKGLLRELTRGLPRLRTLRDIMEEVYRLFDRRFETRTALEKSGTLRCRVRRFKKLGGTSNEPKSPNLEKALVFLDDESLGATSNAVERSNRRFRKAQGSIYSVGTREHLEERLALDMQREQRAPKRHQTSKTLHDARSGADSLH